MVTFDSSTTSKTSNAMTATRHYLETHPTFAVFSRATGNFLAFMADTPQAKMNHGGHDYQWLALSVAQAVRLGSLTDGDNHINATAKVVSGKARIYSY